MRNRGGNNGFLYRTIALGEVLKIKVVKGVANPNPVVVAGGVTGNSEKKTEPGSEKKEPESEKKEQGEEKKVQEEEKK